MCFSTPWSDQYLKSRDISQKASDSESYSILILSACLAMRNNE